MSVAYFDTSALVKLVVSEAETAALHSWMREPGRPDIIATSTLSQVELGRASRRHSSAAAATAGRVLARVDAIAMTPDILAEAASAEPATLRIVDAIHLATAQRVGSALAAFVAYDSRLVEAASTAGLPVVSPR